MRTLQDSFTRTHGFIVLGFLATFTAFTLYVCCFQGSKSDLRERHITAATLGVLSGPFTGALARPGQSDCVEFGWKLFPYCGGLLAVACGVQFVRFPFPRDDAELIRLVSWLIGCLSWFGGGVLSLLYAFS